MISNCESACLLDPERAIIHASCILNQEYYQMPSKNFKTWENPFMSFQKALLFLLWPQETSHNACYDVLPRVSTQHTTEM